MSVSEVQTPMASERGRTETGEAPIVAAQGLTKIFKDFWRRDRARAVDGIDFEVRPGEIFGLLGPNGSGKSTTIKMILGLLRKTRGRLLVFGKSPSDVAIKKRIGFLPEESYLYPFLNARETLDYYGKLFQLDHRVRGHRIEELLDMVGLAGVQYRQIREYSKGMQRRIGLAQALINDPEFLILDEPTTGLDPIGTRQVKDLIVELGRRGKTVLLSSHLLADVEDCVDRMMILYGGKSRAEGTCAQLLDVHDRSVIETDRLYQGTIDEVRSVIERRAHHVERITRPRQKLEELFVGIVEDARAEQMSTSGALSGGETAAFLRADAPEDQREGKALIEELIGPSESHTDDAEMAATPSRQPEPSIIENLMGEESTGTVKKPASRSTDTSGAGGVDEEVISELLGGADAGSNDQPGPGAGR